MSILHLCLELLHDNFLKMPWIIALTIIKISDIFRNLDKCAKYCFLTILLSLGYLVNMSHEFRNSEQHLDTGIHVAEILWVLKTENVGLPCIEFHLYLTFWVDFKSVAKRTSNSSSFLILICHFWYCPRKPIRFLNSIRDGNFWTDLCRLLWSGFRLDWIGHHPSYTNTCMTWETCPFWTSSKTSVSLDMKDWSTSIDPVQKMPNRFWNAKVVFLFLWFHLLPELVKHLSLVDWARLFAVWGHVVKPFVEPFWIDEVCDSWFSSVFSCLS